MGARQGLWHGPERIAVGLLLVVWLLSACLLTLDTAPASAASPPGCRVRNSDGGRAYAMLQAAEDAAHDGDRLTVSGLCRGSTTIGKDLVIVGIETPASGRPILSGGGRVRVLTVKTPARVRLRDLRVVRGHGKHGGAVLNRGHLLLRDVVVSGSYSPPFWPGGGVANLGTLTLNGSSSIRGNAADQGGGVENHGQATLRLNGSSTIRGNGATYAGGVYNAGTLVMNGTSAIRGNYAEDIGGVTNLGTIVMNDSSTISRNEVSYDEGKVGGVRQSGRSATLTMNDTSSISGHQRVAVWSSGGLVRLEGSSSISANRSTGAAVDEGGRLVFNDVGSIHSNSGGGVWVQEGRVSLNDASSIHDNTGYSGAGVDIGPGTLILRDTSSIYGNRTVGYVDDEDGDVPPGPGGGIYVGPRSTLAGVACGPEGNVRGNTPDDCYVEP